MFGDKNMSFVNVICFFLASGWYHMFQMGSPFKTGLSQNLKKWGHVSSKSKESEVITWKPARKSRSFAIRLILPQTAPITVYYVTSS